MRIIKWLAFLVFTMVMSTVLAQSCPGGGGCVGGVCTPDCLGVQFCINPSTVAAPNILTTGDLPISINFTSTSTSGVNLTAPSQTSITIPVGAVLTNSSPDTTGPSFCTGTFIMQISSACTISGGNGGVCRFNSTNTSVNFTVTDLNRLYPATGNPINLITGLQISTLNTSSSPNGLGPQVRLMGFPGASNPVNNAPGGYPRNGTCVAPFPGGDTNYCKRSVYYSTCSTYTNDYSSICNYAYADINPTLPTSGPATYKGTYSINLNLGNNVWMQSLGVS